MSRNKPSTDKKKPKDPFRPALAGLKVLAIRERNFRIHLVFTALALAGCFFFNVQPYEWIAVLILIATVLCAEALNTSIEIICDYINPEWHPMIKQIKDIAAAAVLICALIAVVVGCIIFIPYLIELLGLAG